MVIITSYDQDPNAPSIPCIREYVPVNEHEAFRRYIEVCDVEPGIEYNPELAQHSLAAALLVKATMMYGHNREE